MKCGKDSRGGWKERKGMRDLQKKKKVGWGGGV